MICKKCGNELEKGEKVCSKCGNKVEKKGTVCGICGIIFAFLISLVGFILGIIATVKGAKTKNKTALILGIVSIVVSIVFQYIWAKYGAQALGPIY